jgi:hypothetical protein
MTLINGFAFYFLFIYDFNEKYASYFGLILMFFF